jgi:hypothetical protein
LGLKAAFTPTTSMAKAIIAVMINAKRKATICLRMLFSPEGVEQYIKTR